MVPVSVPVFGSYIWFLYLIPYLVNCWEEELRNPAQKIRPEKSSVKNGPSISPSIGSIYMIPILDFQFLRKGLEIQHKKSGLKNGLVPPTTILLM